MALTKPAGVAIQLIALLIFLASIIPVANGSFVTAAVMWGIAVWLMLIGRKPAVRDR